MPSSKRKPVKARSVSGSEDEDYKKKRKRNNEAVKRSRVKSKQKAVQTKSRVDTLKHENEKLESNIDQKRKQILTLKELFLETASRKTFSPDQKVDLVRLLADDDDPSQPSGSKK